MSILMRVASRIIRLEVYCFLDVVFCRVKLLYREKYVAEVCIGVFGSNVVINIPDQDISVYFDGLIIVARF